MIMRERSNTKTQAKHGSRNPGIFDKINNQFTSSPKKKGTFDNSMILSKNPSSHMTRSIADFRDELEHKWLLDDEEGNGNQDKDLSSREYLNLLVQYIRDEEGE
jgi:hypothetical protein